jgi:hypothetical protein
MQILLLSCLRLCWLATMSQLTCSVQSSILLLVLASTVVLGFQIHRNPWHNYGRQSQIYFTTGDLPPIISSWLQAPWGSRPQIFFLQLNSCGHGPYVTPSLPRRWVSPMTTLGLSSSVRIALIAYYWKFFRLYCIQVLCQSRLCKADHV